MVCQVSGSQTADATSGDWLKSIGLSPSLPLRFECDMIQRHLTILIRLKRFALQKMKAISEMIENGDRPETKSSGQPKPSISKWDEAVIASTTPLAAKLWEKCSKQ